MRCVYCNSFDSKVVDSRPTDDYMAIRRRRVCLTCGRRFTTYEKVEVPLVLVVKKDGSREPFNPDKIRRGIVRACEKRPVTAYDIDDAVGEIERKVVSRMDKEITSSEIGEMVMDSLRSMDQVAYVRFASVYRQFGDINTFMSELSQLLKKDEKGE